MCGHEDKGVWSPHFGDWDRLPSSLPPPREHFGDCERPPSSFPQQPHLSDRQRPPSPFLPPDHISNPHLSSSRDPGYNDEDGNDKRHHHSSQQQQQQQLPLPLSTPPPPARSETIQTDKVGRRRHADSSVCSEDHVWYITNRCDAGKFFVLATEFPRKRNLRPPFFFSSLLVLPYLKI
ncbi:hypothetical protein BGW80DRAFT_1445355 [Lactifluus volemus]|nr:hypothetical protein BGW80DRAFT_1445355 [Lactifluus volemus]